MSRHFSCRVASGRTSRASTGTAESRMIWEMRLRIPWLRPGCSIPGGRCLRSATTRPSGQSILFLWLSAKRFACAIRRGSSFSTCCTHFAWTRSRRSMRAGGSCWSTRIIRRTQWDGWCFGSAGISRSRLGCCRTRFVRRCNLRTSGRTLWKMPSVAGAICRAMRCASLAWRKARLKAGFSRRSFARW